MTDRLPIDPFAGPPPVTLRLQGDLYDGLTWPWPGGMSDTPEWIILGCGHLHSPTKEHIYRQSLGGIGWDLVRSILRYTYTGQSPGAYIQNVTLENNEYLRDAIDELQQKHAKTVKRLQEQLNRCRGAAKAAATRRRNKQKKK